MRVANSVFRFRGLHLAAAAAAQVAMFVSCCYATCATNQQQVLLGGIDTHTAEPARNAHDKWMSAFQLQCLGPLQILSS